MSKGYLVNRAFNAPSLDVWITRDTAHLLDKLPAPELKSRVEDGSLTEVELPPGCTTVEQAQALDDAKAQAKKEAAAELEQESAAEANEKAAAALEAALDKLGPKATPAKQSKGGK